MQQQRNQRACRRLQKPRVRRDIILGVSVFLPVAPVPLPLPAVSVRVSHPDEPDGVGAALAQLLDLGWGNHQILNFGRLFSSVFLTAVRTI